MVTEPCLWKLLSAWKESECPELDLTEFHSKLFKNTQNIRHKKIVNIKIDHKYKFFLVSA